nr:genetic competence negative regulator [Bacillus sp. JCM 19034]
MRLERLNPNKFKAYLSNDDMKDRGIKKDDLWKDLPKVHDLFRDMMIEADDELGFKIDGPIAVEVFAVPSQGMVIVVSKCDVDEWTEDEFEDGYIEMQVTLDEMNDFYYVFDDFENLISLSKRLHALGIKSGDLYSFKEKYYLAFDEFDIDIELEDAVIALLAEYGTIATASIHLVREYGKCIIENNAVELIVLHFI